MNSRNSPTAWSLAGALFAFTLATGIAAPVGAQETMAKPGFPDAHKMLLSASTYRALFGQRLDGAAALSQPRGNHHPRSRPAGNDQQVNEPQVPFPDGLLGRSETSIAIGGNGARILVGWNDAEGLLYDPFGPGLPALGVIGYGYSSDGGKTFVDAGGPPLAPDPNAPDPLAALVGLADPSLDVGGFGNDTFYFAKIAVYDSSTTSLANPSITAGVSVHRGRFHGKRFAWEDPVLLFSPNFDAVTGTPRDFLDKEHIAADKSGARPHVYVSLTNFIEVDGLPANGFGQIEAYASTDGGDTYERSIVQPDETLQVIPGDTGVGIVNQGPQPAVGPNGTVYVVWIRGILSPFGGQAALGVWPEIRFARSTDFGRTWEPAAAQPGGSGVNPAGQKVADICSGDFFLPAGYTRLATGNYPRIAVAQNGPWRGRVYVTWQDCRIANGGTQAEIGNLGNADTDAYVSYSDDGGSTWSPPTIAGPAGDGSAQFWPTISLRHGGAVDVTYFQQDAGTCVVNLYWAQSLDGGLSWRSPVKVTDIGSDWCTTVSDLIPNFGDYNTAVGGGGTLFATWADGRNGVPDVFFSRIKIRGRQLR